MDNDWLAHAILRGIPDAIVVAEPGGTIAEWNAGAERVFGYPSAAALGQSLDLIIPEKQRARHWAGYAKTMATGETKYGDTLLQVPAIHADGRRLSLEFSVALLCDADGKVAAIAAVIRDVTERWAAERDLRQRLAEAERRLRDLEGAAAGGAEP